MKRNLINRLLVFSAAADFEVLQKCPHAEQQRVLTQGVAVLVPAVLALFSGSIAAPLFGEGAIRYILPIGLALLIYFLDRSIVLYTTPGVVNYGIVGRVMLAVLLGWLLAEPLVLHLFRDKILSDEKQREAIIDQRCDSILQSATRPLEALMRANDAQTLVSEKEYLLETDGQGGSLNAGIGRIAGEKQKAFDRQVQKARTDSTMLSAKTLDARKMVEHTRSIQKQTIAADLAGRIETLHRLANESPPIWYSTWLIRLLLILIDLLPILLKVIRVNVSEMYPLLLQQKHDAILEANQQNAASRFATYRRRIETLHQQDSHQAATAAKFHEKETKISAINDLAQEHYALDRAKTNAFNSIALGNDEKLAQSALDQLGKVTNN